ncbi:hypothetical protein BJX64DRAFT_284345 [Aspergillus heterothallicus]
MRLPNVCAPASWSDKRRWPSQNIDPSISQMIPQQMQYAGQYMNQQPYYRGPFHGQSSPPISNPQWISQPVGYVYVPVPYQPQGPPNGFLRYYNFDNLTDENAQQYLPPTARVLVGNLNVDLPSHVIKNLLKDLFRMFGRNWVHVSDREREKYPVAFVQFAFEEHANAAISCNRKVGWDRKLRIELCNAGRRMLQTRFEADNSHSFPQVPY